MCFNQLFECFNHLFDCFKDLLIYYIMNYYYMYDLCVVITQLSVLITLLYELLIYIRE